MPSYVQELMKLIQASNEKVAAMEERVVQLTKIIRGDNGKNPETTGNPTRNGDTSETENGVTNEALDQTHHTIKDPVTSNETTEGTSGFITKHELQKLLEQRNETLDFSEFDLRFPYPARIAAKPYPKDYTSPKFKMFDGKIGDAREHVMKFMETLGVTELDDDLKLREFSKSLTGKAYTWYINLVPGSVESWSQMCKQFGEKFFSTQEKITLIDLGREYQKSREDLMEYIQLFRERVLDIHEAHDEKELVKVCIQGMSDKYRVHLENLSLSTFAALVEAARRTNNTVHRQKE